MRNFLNDDMNLDEYRNALRKFRKENNCNMIMAVIGAIALIAIVVLVVMKLSKKCCCDDDCCYDDDFEDYEDDDDDCCDENGCRIVRDRDFEK